MPKHPPTVDGIDAAFLPPETEQANSHHDPASHGALPSGYEFLRVLLAPDQVSSAARAASRTGIPLHLWLIYTEAISAETYVRGLATALGLPAAEDAGCNARAGTARIDGLAFSPAVIAGCARRQAAKGRSVVLIWSARDRSPASSRRRRIAAATRALARSHPELSAAYPLWTWQMLGLIAIGGALLGAFAIAPGIARTALSVLLAAPFLIIVLWRLLALIRALSGHGALKRRPARRDLDLPSYFVLVPLFREADVVPGLVAALDRLDYPRDRLDVILILEATDLATRAAARAVPLPPWFRVIVVPDGYPRTKPRALCYALGLARGEYVAVYDAEDTPDPQQLRLAVDAFRRSNGTVGCVQARLVIENAQSNWLSRHFALEYAALFRGLLPVLARWRLPVPLGGTSNHFDREMLIAAGGWDPYNVTEDADLGVRLLHRLGLRVAVIASQTLEEAPMRFGSWLRQRTRWLKGWMQTYAVHMRRPWRLRRELGRAGFWAFQCVFGGMVLSALVHPLFYILLFVDLGRGELLSASTSEVGRVLWAIAWMNLIAGYASTMALCALASGRQGLPVSVFHLITLPVYWLLVSIAAYRAAYQLAVSPHTWEKTDHSPRRP